MAGFASPMEKVQRLFEELKKLEAKLHGSKPVPMKEQQKLHGDIKRIQTEIAKLERQVIR